MVAGDTCTYLGRKIAAEREVREADDACGTHCFSLSLSLCLFFFELLWSLSGGHSPRGQTAKLATGRKILTLLCQRSVASYVVVNLGLDRSTGLDLLCSQSER